MTAVLENILRDAMDGTARKQQGDCSGKNSGCILTKDKSIKSYYSASADRHFLGCTTALQCSIYYFTVARFKGKAAGTRTLYSTYGH